MPNFGKFYWSDFLTGFCGRVPLLLTTLLLLATATASSPQAFGLPGLVWHDQPGCQLAVGVAFGLVWVQCLLVGYLLHDEGGQRLDPIEQTTFGNYAVWISVCVAITAGGVGGLMWILSWLRDWLFALQREAPVEGLAGWDASWYGIPFAVGFLVACLAAVVCNLPPLPGLGAGFARWLVGWVKGLWGSETPKLGPLSLAGLILVGVALYLGLAFLETFATGSWYRLWEFGLFQLSILVLASYLLILVVLIQDYLAGKAQAKTSGTPEGDAVEAAAEKEKLRPEDPAYGFRYVWFLVSIVLLMGGTWLPLFASPLIALGLLIFLVLAIYGALVTVLKRLAPVVVVIAAVLLLIGGLPLYRYPIPGLEEYYSGAGPVHIDSRYGLREEKLAEEPTSDPSQLIPIGKVPYKQESGFNPADMSAAPRYPANEKRPLVLVTASGGGIRAAVWTLRVLQRLESDLAGKGIDFPQHVRIMTGASGGMLGSAVYAAGLTKSHCLGCKVPMEERRQRFDLMRRHHDRLAGDALTPVMNTFVFRDLPCALSPWGRGYDRGRRLEDVWKTQLDELLQQPFSALKEHEEGGEVPSLIFSPMLVEDGRRLVISNLDLGEVLSNEGNQLGAGPELAPLQDTYSREALELFELFPKAKDKFTLATAARLSASFPYVAPAAHLPTIPRRRVVDAGYYDNYGVSLAASWLLNEEQRGAIQDNISGIVVIQIRDAPSEVNRRLLQPPPDRSSLLSRSLEEVTSPPEGLWSMRDASSSFRNDSQLERLSWVFNGKKKDSPLRSGQTQIEESQRFFTVLTFELPARDVPLSWYLSEQEKKSVDRTAPYPEWDEKSQGWPLRRAGESESAKRFDQSVDALLAWWAECDARAKR